MNEITQTAAALTLEQCDDLLITGVCNIRDAILGYTKNGLTQPQISERVKALGFKASIRTIQNHVKDLRQEGLLPAVGTSERTKRLHRQQERQNRKNCGIATDTTTTIPTDDYPNPPAPTPEQQRLQADDWDDATVVTTEVVTMPDGELDFQRAQQLFDELIRLSKANFANGWTQVQWNTLGGYCRTLEECCNARGGRVSSALKQPVPNGAAFSLGAN